MDTDTDYSQGTLIGQVFGLLVTCAVLLAIFHMRRHGVTFDAIMDDPGLLVRGMFDQSATT